MKANVFGGEVNNLKHILTTDQVQLLKIETNKGYKYKATFQIRNAKQFLYEIAFIILYSSDKNSKYYVTSWHMTIYLTENSFTKLLGQIFNKVRKNENINTP